MILGTDYRILDIGCLITDIRKLTIDNWELFINQYRESRIKYLYKSSRLKRDVNKMCLH